MTQGREKCWTKSEKLQMVAHKHYSLGQGNYLNIEKQDWKMDGKIKSQARTGEGYETEKCQSDFPLEEIGPS